MELEQAEDEGQPTAEGKEQRRGSRRQGLAGNRPVRRQRRREEPGGGRRRHERTAGEYDG
jgi:hypothetical protein